MQEEEKKPLLTHYYTGKNIARTNLGKYSIVKSEDIYLITKIGTFIILKSASTSNVPINKQIILESHRSNILPCEGITYSMHKKKIKLNNNIDFEIFKYIT